MRHSTSLASRFFESRHVVLVPNCSIGIKSVLERLVAADARPTAAYLSPVYGATQKLLQCFKNEGALRDVIAVAPGKFSFL
jgi:hypothetical protein